MTELIPFGKHKGQPVEVLMADPGYKEWLMAQPWFRERYGNVYQTIINYGGEAQETPEHNEMQIAFLDSERSLALAKTLFSKHHFDFSDAMRRAEDDLASRQMTDHVKLEQFPARTYGCNFEVDGWDVTFDVRSDEIYAGIESLPACICVCDHAECGSSSTCNGGDVEWKCEHRSCDKRRTPTIGDLREFEEGDSPVAYANLSGGHCNKACPYYAGRYGVSHHSFDRWLVDDAARSYTRGELGTVHVECKPDIGDDFPAVLRQVKGRPRKSWDVQCVIVRRCSFERVTWDQVREVFWASRVHLIGENIIDRDETVA